MRIFYCFVLLIVGLYLACTSPVEQSTITSQVSTQQLFAHQNRISGLAWSPDSAKIAYHSPVAKFSILQFGLSGQFLDTLATFTTPYVSGDVPDIRISPNGDKVLYAVSDKAFKIMSLSDQSTKTLTYPDTNGVSTPHWAPDNERLYGIIKESNLYYLQIIHPESQSTETFLLDSLRRPNDVTLMPEDWILYTGYDSDNQAHFWAKQGNSSAILVAHVRANEMAYLVAQNSIVYSYYNYDTRSDVLATFSLNDGQTFILSSAFESIRAIKQITGESALHIYASHDTDGVGLFRLALSGEHQLLSSWMPPFRNQWLADALSISVPKAETFSTLYVYDVIDQTVRELTPGNPPANNLDPAFTPNSQDIIFTKNGQLYTVSATGGDARPLTLSGTPPQYHPEVSPDGSQIAFDDGYDLYVMPAAGGESQNLSKDVIYSLKNPTWSPDGAKLAGETQDMLIIFSLNQGQSEIDKMVSGRFEHITWSRKTTPLFGDPILARNGYFNFVMIDAETGRVVNEFDIRRNIESFCWAPNGREMAYSASLQVFRTPLLTTLK